jgi:acetyl-CoA C-acetyltransferase
VAAADIVVLGWARSPVVPEGGALRDLLPHQIGGPVLAALLNRSHVAPEAVDAVLAGNALGAGGNPARLVALTAGLPDRVAGLSLDSQCDSGLDAVIMAAGLLAGGAAEVVAAGGVEAWSRAPLRAHRPRAATDAPIPYDRPPFAPDPARDPDLLEAAAGLAARRGIGRDRQDEFAAESHARALAARAAMRSEIVALAGLDHDPYARHLSSALLRRMPLAARSSAGGEISRAGLACKADGAAFVLLATAGAARRLGLPARFAYRAGAIAGGRPDVPMLAALPACRQALARAGAPDLWGAELHEAFAVQALCLIADLGLDPARVGRGGGGLARGHPIGASGAVSLVRLLADMDRLAPAGATGLAAIAAAGGLGSAVVVARQ